MGMVIENIDPNGKIFSCPSCYRIKANKYYTIYDDCRHVSCDTCTRMWQADKCALCNQQRAILRQGEASPGQEGESDEDLNEEEEKEELPDLASLNIGAMSREQMQELLQSLQRNALAEENDAKDFFQANVGEDDGMAD